MKELVGKFFEPEMRKKLEEHDKTQIYFRDQDFLDVLEEIREDPQKLKLR